MAGLILLKVISKDLAEIRRSSTRKIMKIQLHFIMLLDIIICQLSSYWWIVVPVSTRIHEDHQFYSYR